MTRDLDPQRLLDAMHHATLIFDAAGKWIADNAAARALLGVDLRLLRSQGWTAALALFNARTDDGAPQLDIARDAAQTLREPQRFYAQRAGERIPGWVSIIGDEPPLTLLTLEQQDWNAVSELVGRYMDEVREALVTTQGHNDLIERSVREYTGKEPADRLIRRVAGFSHVIRLNAHRLSALTDLITRYQAVRTGAIRSAITDRRRRFNLHDFIEDWLEGLMEVALLDPDTNVGDFRQRVETVVPLKLEVFASPPHLTTVISDLLRNAIMYSMRGTPVRLIAYGVRDTTAQIEVIDEGYGIRKADFDRVFQPFTRGRQPQVMGEFGYGISLYLCKHEVEAMGGRLWFTSEEGVGSTFTVKLPLSDTPNR